ncbi:Mrx6 protein [Saccharomycopsis crataegensis]|uniref:Mrx6 protein n=1 Tax=Saccharomycopsis crataegensis TaxID=43959 RepID=A0AAV5QWR4_9ASCO|nr:Mrx6 protein [Saccharomycopsis crataegensis]
MLTVKRVVLHPKICSIDNISSLSRRWNSTTAKSLKPQQLNLPRVRDTQNISQRVVNLEGLFAGYKPLFLGNGSAELDPLANIDEFEDLFGQNEEMGGDQPLVPWNASIGGLLYNDDAFRGVPKDVVKQLPFFKPPEANKEGGNQNKRSKYINFKVHNKIVDGGLFDNYQSNARSKKAFKKKSIVTGANNKISFTPGNVVDDTYDHYADLFSDYLYSNDINLELIKEKESLLQCVIDNFKNKLNNELRKKYGTELLSNTPIYRLPRYIFVQRKTISSKSLFKKKLYKILLKETAMLYRMSHGFRATEYNKDRFRKSFMKNVKLLVNNLVKKISIDFQNPKFADALVIKKVLKSANGNAKDITFGRIYWFNPKRRFDLIRRGKQQTALYHEHSKSIKGWILTPMSLICRHGIEQLKVVKENIKTVDENEQNHNDISNDSRK